jgi:AraC-like DNA-binding protein
MGVKKFQLAYYNNATDEFHIQCVTDTHLASHPHSHGYFQIYYVISGNLYHYVGGESACMVKGDMVIIPPDVIHHVSADGGTVFYSFSFDSGFLLNSIGTPRPVTNLLYDLLRSDVDKIRATVSMPVEDIFYMESLMAHILREFVEKPMGYYDNVRMLASLVISYLARSYYEIHSVKEYVKANKEIIRHCVEFIESYYSEDISIDKVAQQFNMSVSSFCKLFITETGYTFNHYLNRRRIEKACEYISAGYKLTALSAYVGYNDFSTFYRNFKKHIGVSPSEYKRRLSAK